MSLYISLFIDDEKQGADQVVIIEPALPDLNAAYYVLKTYTYAVYPGFVIQLNDSNSVQKFVDHINEWSEILNKDQYMSQDKIFQILKKDIEEYPEAIIMWSRREGEKVQAARIVLPTENNMPVGINPKNKNIWIFMIRNYREKIRSYSKAEEQWASAIIMYKRICLQNNLKPFLGVPLKKKQADDLEEERTKLVTKIKKGYEQANILTTAICDNFSTQAWVSELGDSWKYYGIEKATRYSALLYKDLTLTNRTYKEVIDYLVKHEGFRKVSNQISELRIDAITSILFQQKENGKPADMHTVIKFTLDKNIASLLFQLDSSNSADEYLKAMKHWMEDTFEVKA